MTTEIIFKVNERELERVVGKMPFKFKLELVRKLEEETREKRWDALFRRIDERFQKHPITERELAQEISIVRKTGYAKSHY